MPKPGKSGFIRVLHAARYSSSGLKAAFKHEAAFRQELFLCMVLAPVAFWVAHTGIARALLIGSLLLVLMVELLNSAIEAVVDRVSEEHHELAGRAKDIGSAAVFVALLNVVVTWALVLT